MLAETPAERARADLCPSLSLSLCVCVCVCVCPRAPAGRPLARPHQAPRSLQRRLLALAPERGVALAFAPAAPPRRRAPGRARAPAACGGGAFLVVGRCRVAVGVAWWVREPLLRLERTRSTQAQTTQRTAYVQCGRSRGALSACSGSILTRFAGTRSCCARAVPARCKRGRCSCAAVASSEAFVLGARAAPLWHARACGPAGKAARRAHDGGVLLGGSGRARFVSVGAGGVAAGGGWGADVCCISRSVFRSRCGGTVCALSEATARRLVSAVRPTRHCIAHGCGWR